MIHRHRPIKWCSGRCLSKPGLCSSDPSATRREQMAHPDLLTKSPAGAGQLACVTSRQCHPVRGKIEATSPRGKSKAPAARSISAGETQLRGWAEQHEHRRRSIPRKLMQPDERRRALSCQQRKQWHYSIALSASASRWGGTSMPSAFAVCRLRSELERKNTVASVQCLDRTAEHCRYNVLPMLNFKLLAIEI